MKDYRDVIINPIITEKSTIAKESNNIYAFEINPKYNKNEIKEAVEKLFDVNVLDVNIVRIRGKVKRTRGILGRRKNRKKAYVKIKENQRIELFEGA